MEPAHAFFHKNFAPINLAGPKLRHGGVPAIRTTQWGACPKSAFGKIETVAHRAAHAIVISPAHMAQINAALKHEVFAQAPDRIIGERGDDGGAQTKTTAQSAGHVVF